MPVQIDPATGERVNTPEIDPDTGERRTATPPDIPGDAAPDAFKAGVHSQMLGVSPGYAYQNRDEIDTQFRARDPEYDNDSFMGAVETGIEDTPLGMLVRGKAPEEFDSDSAFLRFVHNTVSFATDPVILIPTIGGVIADAAVPGAAVGGFVGGSALDAGLRKAILDHYQKGDVKSFGELTDRAGDALWEATKGALTSEVFGAAGDLPVPSAIADKPLMSTAMRGLYQASAVTTAGALLNGQVPKLRDFEDSALQVVPLNLATGGLLLRGAESKQALMDVYQQDGTTPERTEDKLTAQPPVKPEPPPGLRPAINSGDAIAEADEDEHHADLAQRVLGQKPLTMEELEADPARADEVLQSPKIQEQEVIDRAWTLKEEAIAAGDETQDSGTEAPQSIYDLYNRNDMKSGRGFVTPDGKFLTREQAKVWVKNNEPEIHTMWQEVADDPKKPFDSEDYEAARDRVNARTLAQGEKDLNGVYPQLLKWLGNNRAELNGIKASDIDSNYGKSLLRTTLVGPRNMLTAEVEQVVGRAKKLIPDSLDQEALTIMRDYKDTPVKLQNDLDSIRSGDNEKLKALIPSIERAQNPTPQLLAADKELTDYFSTALTRLQSLGLIERGLPPDRYITHLLMRVSDEGETEGKLGPYTKNRKYDTIIDALKTGRIEAQTINALDALSIYGSKTGGLIANKLFGMELKNTELGVQGTPESHPVGWREVAPMRRGLAGIYAPKSLADAMKPIFEYSDSPGKIGLVQSFTKSLELSLSVFHMKAMTITAMNNMSLDGYVRALHSDNSSPQFEADEREGALHGLETTKTGPQYEAYKGLKSSSVPTGLDKLANVPVIKQIDEFAKGLTKATFDVIQRKFKVTDFASQRSAWTANHPDATPQEYGTAMRGIAKEVNAAYGGLNWDVLGVSKFWRNFSRMVMLAPDWTFSNVLNLKYAGEGGAGGNAARAFWVKSFATGIAMTYGTSVLAGGKYDRDHPMQVYLGKDKDGKDMRANWFFAGAPKDAGTLYARVAKDGPLVGLAEFMAYKLGPIGSLLKGLSDNKDFTGKPISKADDTFGEKSLEQGRFAAQKLVPITGTNLAETYERMLKDPINQWTYKDYLEVAGDAVGVTTTHQEDKGSAPGESTRLPGERKRSGGFHLPGMRRR